VEEAGVARDEGLLAVFEGGEVDGGVGEHAGEAHGQAAVEGADARRAPHFEGGGGDEAVAVEAALDGFALHAAGKGLVSAEEDGRGGKGHTILRCREGILQTCLMVSMSRTLCS